MHGRVERLPQGARRSGAKPRSRCWRRSGSTVPVAAWRGSVDGTPPDDGRDQAILLVVGRRLGRDRNRLLSGVTDGGSDLWVQEIASGHDLGQYAKAGRIA